MSVKLKMLTTTTEAKPNNRFKNTHCLFETMITNQSLSTDNSNNKFQQKEGLTATLCENSKHWESKCRTNARQENYKTQARTVDLQEHSWDKDKMYLFNTMITNHSPRHQQL